MTKRLPQSFVGRPSVGDRHPMARKRPMSEAPMCRPQRIGGLRRYRTSVRAGATGYVREYEAAKRAKG